MASLIDRKAASASLGRLLEHTFFQLRQADSRGETYHPRGRAGLSLALNRALAR